MDELQVGAGTAIQPASVTTPCSARAERVRRDLIALKQSMTISFFDIGELMIEARDNGFHFEWGYQSLDQWIENNMEMSARQGYYLMRIIEGQRKLDIPRNALVDLNMSKLKNIFSLNLEENETDIRRLLAAAATMSTDTVDIEVQKVKNRGTDIKPTVLWTLKLAPEVKEMGKALFDVVRASVGKELSDGQCFEYILAEFSAGLSNATEQQNETQQGQTTEG